MSSPRLTLENVVVGQLPRFSGALEPGLYTLFGGDVESLDALVAVFAGLAGPKRGRIRIGGLDPFRSPGARRRIGALLRHEGPAGDLRRLSVERHVEDVLAARADTRSAHTVLSEFALEGWLPRPLAQLHAEERRNLAQSLALSTPDPLLVVLHEPLTSSESSETLRARLVALASHAIVLSVTSSALQVQALAGRAIQIHSGQLRTEPTEEAAHQLDTAEVVVRVHTPEPARLVEVLASLARTQGGVGVGAVEGAPLSPPRISGVSWDGRHGSDMVVFEGHPGKTLVLSVLRHALAQKVPIFALSTSPSPWPAASAQGHADARVSGGSAAL